MLYQPPRDGGAGAIAFRSAMARFAEQYDTGIGEAIEHRPEGGIVNIGQRSAPSRIRLGSGPGSINASVP